MPELPEVETTRRGIEPHIVGTRIERLIVRQHRLRWPVPGRLASKLRDSRITGVLRFFFNDPATTESGTLIIHLGMSGKLRIVDDGAEPGPHDHIDMLIDTGIRLRFTDPRRFGAWLWTRGEPASHALLRHLGPEPLDGEFSGGYLYQRTRGRRLAVKSLLMDGRTVAGVGNIYANEALFGAGIHPGRSAGRISLRRYETLVRAVRDVLTRAIGQGGTTLRDFVGGEGRPGYFQQSLQVYGRTGRACPLCATPIREIRTGQRSTFYCPCCQR